MKKLKKILKKMSLIIGGLILLIAIIIILFVNLSPEFGGSPTQKQKDFYAKSKNYNDGIFVNQIPTSMDMGAKKMINTIIQFIKGNPKGKPKVPLQVEKIDSLTIERKTSELTRLTWFGHSAFLLEIDEKNILIDPMLGDFPAPHPVLGSGRFSKELPIEIEKLPHINAVIISHDHYDHLDYGSILKLKDKVDEFYVPLGVGVHLEVWGIPKNKIHELNWWDEIEHDNLKFVCAPSRHFSGRGLTDRSSTLWCSWIIKSPKHNIYFSGDSGYGPHFKEIGEKFGPFDFAMMECGQYNENWSSIHMMPEETVIATQDVKAELMMPIHWGAFTLALHDWTNPIERVTAKASELNVPITTPKIGEAIILGDSILPSSKWWLDYQ